MGKHNFYYWASDFVKPLISHPHVRQVHVGRFIRGFSRHTSQYHVFTQRAFSHSASKYFVFTKRIISHLHNKKGTPCGVLFLFASVEVLLATANSVAVTAVHDEEPGQNIADITTTATHQEKDEDVVVATTSAVCSTVCKKVHYVVLLIWFLLYSTQQQVFVFVLLLLAYEYNMPWTTSKSS